VTPTPNARAANFRRVALSDPDAEAIFNAAECQSCAFYEAKHTQCRALPPRPLTNGKAVFPEMQPSDWCGSWEANWK